MTYTMKQSGIELIGDIPTEWEAKPLKYCVDINQSVLVESTPPSYEFRYVDIGAVTFTDGITEYEETTFENAPSRARRIVHKGDTLVSTVRTYLKAIARITDDDNVIASTGFAVLTPNHADDGFLEFFCKSEAFCEEIDKQSSGIAYPAVNSSQVGRVYMPLPPLAEQHAIAAFLYDRCGYIDGIVADLERQVEILRQYKKALITETVTKGLDKSVPMKDSGIDWIGHIPSHYKLKKLKHIVTTKITDGPHETPDLIDDGIPFLSAESVKECILDFNYKRGYISLKDHQAFCRKCKPQLHDIFMVKSGATTGKTGMVMTEEEFSVWSPLALIRCDDVHIKQKFVYYSLLSNYFTLSVELAWSYGTQQNIGMGVIENLRIVLPPNTEQETIVEFLNAKCAEMDALIAEKQLSVETMRQYKRSLIYEYVTGKKRVAS